MCAKSFTNSQSLLRHSMSHTGNKPFSCNVCDKKFSQAPTLKRHQRIHTSVLPPRKRGRKPVQYNSFLFLRYLSKEVFHSNICFSPCLSQCSCVMWTVRALLSSSLVLNARHVSTRRLSLTITSNYSNYLRNINNSLFSISMHDC